MQGRATDVGNGYLAPAKIRVRVSTCKSESELTMVFSSSGGIDESSSLAVTAMESLASMTGGCVLASYEMWGRETDIWLSKGRLLARSVVDSGNGENTAETNCGHVFVIS